VEFAEFKFSQVQPEGKFKIMFMKRTTLNKNKTHSLSCMQCYRIRLFLLTATPLICGLFFIEKDTTPLAGATPMKAALLILGLGSLGFLIRVLQYIGKNKPPEDNSH
jgi:hypothetical protein